MLGGVHIRGLARHKVQEAVELDKAGRVGVDDGEDALEVDLALLVLPDGVAEGDEAVLELTPKRLKTYESRSLALVTQSEVR